MAKEEITVKPNEAPITIIDDPPSAELAAIPTGLEVQLDAQKAVARIQALTQVIDACTKISLQRTNPRDWVRMKGKDGIEKFYLQSTGIQKVRAIWGIYYKDRTMKKEILPNNHYSYITEGLVGSRVLDQLYGETTIEVVGARSSNDKFFTDQPGQVDEQDIRKAALANWEVRAVTALLGLGNMLSADLEKNGVPVKDIASFEFRGGDKGPKKDTISEAQAKRLYTIAHGNGWTDPQIKEILEKKGFKSSLEIPWKKYEEVVDRFQKHKPGDVLTGEE